ncbi:uncharacterized protein LOC113040794 [Carassius auratus]|uniref:Uncharacterized protein LOC113040794 n=1 Tax=Carassius auratus TaxID=7957 RepID=A0A6P6J3S1_CARAU|nr:uncharacterized protein LOC113040794 [Carassius auratus]
MSGHCCRFVEAESKPLRLRGNILGSSGVVADDRSTFLTEGDSVTLNTGVKINQQDVVLWYFNNSRIAVIAGDLSFICTDVQCKNGTERFRNRLKLDHQTGSLTIMNITNTDSGLYMLQFSSGSQILQQILVCVSDVPAARRDEMKTKSVVEGEPVTLHPGVTKTPNVVMTWYCNETLIAEITGDQSKICSDVQCKERFRDRLKLDHQTGSLTITNTRNTDSGEYKLQIRSSRFTNIPITSLKSFIISITDVPAARRDEMKTKSVVEGESFTLHPGVTKTPNVVMTWYCNETLIAEITGDQMPIPSLPIRCPKKVTSLPNSLHLSGCNFRPAHLIFSITALNAVIGEVVA